MTELARRLGYTDDARLVIITCDNLGRTHAGNVGAYESIRRGLATSATLMVPCPWARESAAQYRGEDVGVHLTLNAELDLMRWGPITHAPSLLDGDGGFPRTVDDLWDHADTEEVRRECRAQIERAVLWGFDVTHLDSHGGAMIQRPEFFDVYLDLASESNLPIRLDSTESQATAGFPFRDLARDEGIVSPDHVVGTATGDPAQVLRRAIDDLAPGVTEICVQPAIETPELRAIDPDWARRVAEYELLAEGSELSGAVIDSGAVLIDYRALRAVQRSG